MKYSGKYMSDIRFIGFLYQKAFAVSKTFWIFLLLSVAAKSVSSLLWVYIPKFIIDELTGGKRMETALGYLGVFVVCQILAGAVIQLMNTKITVCNEKIDHHLRKELAAKIMRLEYEKLEDAKILNLKDRASEGMYFWGGISGINDCVVEAASAVLSVVTLLVTIGQLNFVFAILLLVFVVLKTGINNSLRRLVLQFWDKLGIFNRQFFQLMKLMTDYRYGKDIRLYHMSDMILEKCDAYRAETLEYYHKQGKGEKHYFYLQNLVTLVQNLTIYGFVGYYAFAGQIGVGSLVLFITAATNIVTIFTSGMEQLIDMKRICQYASPYMEFMKLPDEDSAGSLPVPVCPVYDLELRNVSFKYPGSENFVLKNVSFRIGHNEKISIVGLNGAGKTTMIKLLLRLYKPTQGEILLNGRNVNEYAYDEYLKLFSAVFQDFRLFAGSVRENIAGAEDGSACGGTAADAKVWASLEKVTLAEKIKNLPKRLDTQLMKSFHEDAVELSGGQNQKIAIARAVYKDTSFVFLDEPTANLDPIAEYEIFRDFNNLVNNKTTIYISHRLSTCRLSDRIVVIDGGEVAEMGTHEELVKQNGLYQRMWDTQAKYYVNI